MLDRVAAEIREELQAQAGQRGSAFSLLVHVLTPSRDGQQHAPGSPGVLFADAAMLTADPGLTEPARQTARILADHLADLIRRGQADGDIRADTDPQAAAWLLLSVLSTRPWRTAAMPDPDRLEGAVTALALRALAPAAGPHHRASARTTGRPG